MRKSKKVRTFTCWRALTPFDSIDMSSVSRVRVSKVSYSLIILGMTINVIPLSPTARFLTTQLSSESFRPNILLPKHLLKPFLTSESTITYINEISPLNSFQRKHTYPTSSTKYLEYISRASASGNAFKDPSSSSSHSQLSIVLPSSQINPILNSESIKFVPPLNSDIVFLDPHFGQIEKYISSIASTLPPSHSSSHTSQSLPRFWSIVSTHLLANAPSWGVRHQSVGEFIISPVSLNLEELRSETDLIESSEVIKKILNTPTLSPQYQPFSMTRLLLLEQLIIEAALCSVIHTEYSSLYEALKSYTTSSSIDSNYGIYSDHDRTISAKSMILRVISECIAVLKRYEPLIKIRESTPMLNAILSKERLFNLTLNIIQSDTSLTHLKNYKYLMKKIQPTDKAYRNEKNSESEDDRLSEMPYPRNPARANNFIFKLGLQNGVKTPANKYVCDLLSAQYPEGEGSE